MKAMVAAMTVMLLAGSATLPDSALADSNRDRHERDYRREYQRGHEARREGREQDRWQHRDAPRQWDRRRGFSERRDGHRNFELGPHAHRHHGESRWNRDQDSRDDQFSHWQRRERTPHRFGHSRYVRPFGYRDYVWHRGARLPAAYCAPRYVVSDYEFYHLRRPPRGHHWIRVDGDVVLAAIASGLVVEVVNGLFY